MQCATTQFAKILFLSLATSLGSLGTSACGNPHAMLQLTAPSSAIVGNAFTVTVTATINGSRDTIINNRIQFKSSDPAAILPASYVFSGADAGSHTFTNGFILMTLGKQTISADIFDATGINGSTVVFVSAAASKTD